MEGEESHVRFRQAVGHDAGLLMAKRQRLYSQNACRMRSTKIVIAKVDRFLQCIANDR